MNLDFSLNVEPPSKSKESMKEPQNSLINAIKATVIIKNLLYARHLSNCQTYILFFFFFEYLFIWLHQVLVAACGIWFPGQESNLRPCIGSMKF